MRASQKSAFRFPSDDGAFLLTLMPMERRRTDVDSLLDAHNRVVMMFPDVFICSTSETFKNNINQCSMSSFC